MKRALAFLSVVITIPELMAGTVIGSAVGATAVAPDWMNGEVRYEGFDSAPLYPKRCTLEYRKVRPVNNRIYTTANQMPDMQLCIYKNSSFEYAEYHRDYYLDGNRLPSMTAGEYSIAFGRAGDEILIPSSLNNDEGLLDRLYSGVDSDVFIRQIREGNNALSLTVYHDPISYMDVDSGGVLRFKASGGYKPQAVFNGTTWGYLSGLGGSVSQNGRYAAFALENVGYVVFDLTANTGRLIYPSFSTASSVWPRPEPSIAVDNTGQYVIVGGWNLYTQVFQVSDSCGYAFSDYVDVMQSNLMTPCTSRDLTVQTRLHSPAWYGYYHFEDVHIGKDGDSFSYFDTDKWATIYAPNYIAPDSMDYIALGDSYSSGEGDIPQIGESHYLPLTNVLGNYKDGIPRELCHVSDRSYPFLLAKDMGVIRGDDMQSVACSGAVRNDILGTSAASYMGQSILKGGAISTVFAPRLEGIPTASALKTDAAQNFVPGRVQQVEFIKRKHPKVATVGISGNDMGFAGILQACLMNFSGGPCDFATADGLADLGKKLQGNYQSQLNFYKELKAASPGTDFYAIGYPQFINDNKVACWSLGNTLSQQERTMMNQSVHYINQTIKNAASSAGIKYIDIENALSGHNICSDDSNDVSQPANKIGYGLLTSKYLIFEDDQNGTINSKSPLDDYTYQKLEKVFRQSSEALSNNPVAALMLVMTETFHPNSTGHATIYQYIHDHQNGTSLLDDTCDGVVIFCPDSLTSVSPELPSFFGVSDADAVYETSLIWQNDSNTNQYTEIGPDGFVERGQAIEVRPINVAASGVKQAIVTLHSNRINLGDMTLQGDTMQPTVFVVPSDISTGFHMLTVEVTDFGGKLIKYMQPLFITGPSNDIDGDGVLNKVDSCEFIAPSGSDSDGDGIDNACDPVNQSPVVVNNAHIKISSPSAGFMPIPDYIDYSKINDAPVELDTVDTENFGTASGDSYKNVRNNEQPLTDGNSNSLPGMYVLLLIAGLSAIAVGVKLLRKKRK